MADLNTQTFDQIVETQATVVQGNSTQLVDYSVGSILLAVAEAVAAVVSWLQGLILTLLTTVRAATSTGADLDSWMADYGVVREAATASTGSETFGRYTATAQATITPGTLVQTGDGTVQFQVVADTTQAAWSSALGAYVLPPGTALITATVQCLVAGTTGNVAAGTVNTLGQGIAGVDYCSNALAFTNGLAAQSDTSLRTAFVAFLASLAKATKGAIGYAITSLQQNLTYAITEWHDTSGNYKPGYFYVVIDDGTGSPTSTELTNATQAVDAVRACGIQFGVFGPSAVNVTVAATVTAETGYTHTAVATAVQTAIEAYISGLGIGVSLTYNRIYSVIYAVPGVATAADLLVNGATSDIAATSQQVIAASSVTVS